MPYLNPKLISVLGKTAMVGLLVFSSHCGSLVKELKCNWERINQRDDLTDDLDTNCAKATSPKVVRSSPSNGETNVAAMSAYRFMAQVANGNKGALDPNNFTVLVKIDNGSSVTFPRSALTVTPIAPYAGNFGGHYVEFNISNYLFNRTNPSAAFNLPYESRVEFTIINGDYSETIVANVENNPTNLPGIQNDYDLFEVVTPNLIRLRNAISNYQIKDINLSSAISVATDVVYSHIENDKLFILKDTGVSARTNVGDPISTGHNVIEIDLLTGNVTTATLPMQTTPVLNTMENIFGAHTGPSSTATTANPPVDWRIYPIVRRRNIVNGAGAELVIRMNYFGGETQEFVINNVLDTFEGATPALSIKLSNNKYVIIPEPGRMLVFTFDYNGSLTAGTKVSYSMATLTIPLTLPNPTVGQYFWGRQLIEDKNSPGQLLNFYNDINLNRFVQKFDVNQVLIGRVQLPATVDKIASHASQTPENALTVHHSTNQVQVFSGQDFALGTLGTSVYSYFGLAQTVHTPPILNVGNQSATQTTDAATEIYNKSQAGFSTVNLNSSLIEKRNPNNGLVSSVNISSYITAMQAALGVSTAPTDAKVIEQGNNYLLVLKMVDSSSFERVRVIDIAGTVTPSPFWTSPAGSHCDMVYGAGKFNNGIGDRLLILYHLNGSPIYQVTDGATAYSSALAGASVNTMTILDADFPNGTPTQMIVAVAKTDGLQILTLNKTNLSIPVSDTTVLNNLTSAPVSATSAIGSTVAIQPSAASDDDGVNPTLYALKNITRAVGPRQILLTTDTVGTLNPGFLEWNASLKLMLGFIRMTDAKFLMVDASGNVYIVTANGNTQRTNLTNMTKSSFFR